MEKVLIEMPKVNDCSVKKCGYNCDCSCHAKAITIGDGTNPGCDTFFDSNEHAKNTRINAGVGACKVKVCKHNKDFECTADKISVGFNDGKINCLSFERK